MTMISRPRFMIAAAHKSSGKTVISTGLAAALHRAGDGVGTFKKGPDYIDPMWLGAATQRACYNLDFNAMRRECIPPFFQSRSRQGAISLIEANKGLYDGMRTDGSDSNAELAKLLGAPVILVIDTVGMTRGIAPLLVGYQTFDTDVTIAGVILNKVGGTRHESKLFKAVETYTDLAVVGSVWRDPGLEIGERHLGLTTPAELSRKDALIAGFADIVGRMVDLDKVRAIARSAPDLVARETIEPAPAQVAPGLRIGVIRDAAFGFYYPDDLEAFEKAGAELVFMDAINDASVPALDGLFIGGGFPELRMQALSANTRFRAQLRTALEAGLPCYAECGGLMYLCETLTWKGQTLPMVGMVPGAAVMHPRPQGRGYARFRVNDNHPWGGQGVVTQAHEFHYASIERLPGNTRYVREMQRGVGVDGRQDGIHTANTVAGFCHLRNSAEFPWVPGFLEFVGRCKAETK